MEPMLLNSNLRPVGVIDAFKSLIWTDRYNEYGDFELVVQPSPNILSMIAESTYARIDESQFYMFIEDLELRTDSEDGDDLIITGRSFESILERRVIWPAMNFTGNLENFMITLLNNYFRFPSDSDREILGINLHLPEDGGSVWDSVLDVQFKGQNVYDVISEIAKIYGVGFKFEIEAESGVYTFAPYNGTDRSYGQTDVPVVEFSVEFDNLLNSTYVETSRYIRNFAYVEGEQGVENTRTSIEVSEDFPAATGFDRKELYIEANVSRNTPDGELDEIEYLTQLENKGLEELAKNIYVQAFDGEVDTQYYKYNTDFFLGDILQISNAYGHRIRSRVVEMIYSQDQEGIKIYPTFLTVE